MSFEWKQTIFGWVINNVANLCPCCVTLWPLQLPSDFEHVHVRSVNPRLSYWFCRSSSRLDCIFGRRAARILWFPDWEILGRVSSLSHWSGPWKGSGSSHRGVTRPYNTGLSVVNTVRFRLDCEDARRTQVSGVALVAPGPGRRLYRYAFPLAFSTRP